MVHYVFLWLKQEGMFTFQIILDRLPLPEQAFMGYWTIGQSRSGMQKLLCPAETHHIDIKVDIISSLKYWIFFYYSKERVKIFSGRSRRHIFLYDAHLQGMYWDFQWTAQGLILINNLHKQNRKTTHWIGVHIH